MINYEREGVKWLEFEIFQSFPEFTHAIFLRHGGYSEGEYASLNFGWHQEDSSEAVSENFIKAQNLLGISKLAWSELQHGNIAISVKDEGYAGIADGLMTTCEGLGLAITHADCQAVVMYDPIRKLAANLHVGWKGNVSGIFYHAVNKMKTEFGSNPKDIHVGISPSLGPQDAQFINYRSELPESFWNYQVKPLYFDLWRISQQQLLDVGIRQDHIQIAAISTFSNPIDYFSYRRIKASGRHATIIALTPV